MGLSQANERDWERRQWSRFSSLVKITFRNCPSLDKSLLWKGFQRLVSVASFARSCCLVKEMSVHIPHCAMEAGRHCSPTQVLRGRDPTCPRGEQVIKGTFPGCSIPSLALSQGGGAAADLMGEGVKSRDTAFPRGQGLCTERHRGLASGPVVSPACWPHLCSPCSETKGRSLPASLPAQMEKPVVPAQHLPFRARQEKASSSRSHALWKLLSCH